MDAQTLLAAIISRESRIVTRDGVSLPAVFVPVDILASILEWLKSDVGTGFDLLLTHTAVDHLDCACFELVYVLFSTKSGMYLHVSTEVPRDNPVVPSVADIWPVAHWQEREVYDLFGVLYDGHPDLRRIFLEDDWVGFPLRKDYCDEYMLERPQWP